MRPLTPRGITGVGNGRLLCQIEGRDVIYITPSPAALAQVLFIAKCSHYGPYLLHTRSPDLGLTDSDRHPGGGPCGVEIDILG